MKKVMEESEEEGRGDARDKKKSQLLSVHVTTPGDN